MGQMIAIFPELAACAAGGDHEALSCLLRSYFGDEQKYSPQIDVAHLFDQMGIKLHLHKSVKKLALACQDEGGAFSITALYGQGIDQNRKAYRFALAALLGRFLIHVQPKILRGDWQTGGYQETRWPHERFIESLTTGQARSEDLFAAALLMPKGMVTKAFQKLQTRDATAAFFAVEPEVLEARLKLLGQKPKAHDPSPPPKAPLEQGLKRLRALASKLDPAVSP